MTKRSFVTRTRAQSCLFLLIALAASSLHAATLRLLNGELIEGRIDPGLRGLTITPLASPPAGIDFNNVLEITFHKSSGPATGWPAGVLLTNRSVVADRNPPALEEQVTTFGVERIPVPTAGIAWLLFDALTPAKLEAAPAGQTGGLMPNGDFFPGTFVSLRGGRVSLNSVLFGPQNFLPRQQIVAVCLREVKPFPGRFVVTTIHGSKFLTDDVHFETALLTLKDTLLGAVRLKSDEIATLGAGPGRVQMLAELKPFRVDTHAGMPATAALHVQRPEGEATVLTTAANIAVSYTLPPGFSTFIATVSLPKDADSTIKASFAVYGDGRPLARTPLYSAADKPAPFRVDLRSAKVVTLRVEPFGANTVVAGDWTAPMILR